MKKYLLTGGELILSLLFALLTSLMIHGLYVFGKGMVPGQDLKTAIIKLVSDPKPVGFVILFVIVSCTVILYRILDKAGKAERLCELLYRFRYGLGGLVLVFCVLFELSGTSAAFWENILISGTTGTGVIFGAPRTIRTDEYATLLPIALSQYRNGFSWISDIVRGTATDVYIEYGAPVRDLSVIFRVFHWGYLFLPPAKGLSFWWCSRMLLLFLTSYDLGHLIGRNRTTAFLYALFMLFSPLIQWWAGVNGLVEMIAYGSGGVLLFYVILTSKKVVPKLCAMLGLSICLGGYVLTMYPAWIVPLAYVFVALVIWLMIREREDTAKVKRWSFWLLGALLIAGIGTGLILYRSADTIASIMNTVYPGKRSTTGGGYFWKYFQYTGNVSGGISEFTNVCEFATLFSMAPIGFLLALYALTLKKKRDSFTLIFLGLELFFVLYSVFAFPMWLSKLTLLSFSTGGRITQIMGITDLLLTVHLLPELSFKNRRDRIALISILLVYAAFIAYANYHEYSWVLSKSYVLLNLLVILASAVLLLIFVKVKQLKALGLAGLTAILFMTGGLVNPVQKGLDCIYKNSFYTAVSEVVSEDPEALFAGEGVWLGDFLIMTGAKTVNSTNVYPNFEYFEKLDPEGEQENVYNRYAHIMITLTEEETAMGLYQDDVIDLEINADDLKASGVKYVAAIRDLSEYSTESTTVTAVCRAENCYLFRLD